MLDSGTLRRYIDELSITGLTSNPTIFDHAIKNSSDYGAAIAEAFVRGSRVHGGIDAETALLAVTAGLTCCSPELQSSTKGTCRDGNGPTARQCPSVASPSRLVATGAR